jgi:hypothetical protein
MEGDNAGEKLSDYLWDDDDAGKEDTKDDFINILSTRNSKEGSSDTKISPRKDTSERSVWTDRDVLLKENEEDIDWLKERTVAMEKSVASEAKDHLEVVQRVQSVSEEKSMQEPQSERIKETVESRIEDLPNTFWGEESDDFASEISRLTLSSTPAHPSPPKSVKNSEAVETKRLDLPPHEIAQPAIPNAKDVASVPKVNVSEHALPKESAHVEAPGPKVAKISVVPTVQRTYKTDECGFNFAEYPRIMFLTTRILVAHPTKQHRLDPRTKTQRESISTLFVLFPVRYNLPSLLNLDCSAVFESVPMFKVLFSGDVKVDNIIDEIGLERTHFLVKKIPESSINEDEIIETFFLNKGVAIKQAMKSNAWAMALFLSASTEYKDEVFRAFLDHFNPMIHLFFGYGELDGDWRQLLVLLLRNPTMPMIDKLMTRLTGIEQLFCALCFYFVHARPIRVGLFFNNFYFLQLALRYGIEAEGLDQLIGRYLKVMQEEGNSDVSKVYSKYKSRKGVQLGETKKGWLEGIRNVVDRSIFKIVGVEAASEPYTEISGVDTSSVQSAVEPAHISEEKGSVPESSEQNLHSERDGGKEGMYSYKKRAANYWDRADQFYQNSTLQAPAEEVVENMENGEEDSEQLAGPSSEGGSVYGNREYSQSYADLYGQEETHSSFLPDILQDDTPVAEKRSAETKPGFFSRFSIFSKKKTYKVELNTNTDFKYDPVTKKWGGSAPMEMEEISKPVPKEIPKPVPSMQKVDNTADGSIKSRYTGRIPTEKQSVSLVDLLPKKK